jgi:hypothetical protein
MKGYLMLLGAVFGAWRRGVSGAVVGAGLGWVIGGLLAPGRSGVAASVAEEHYVRYPEEEIVDALQGAGDEAAVEGAELDDLYREVTGKG